MSRQKITFSLWLGLICCASSARAHVSEQGLVLLLPTEQFITAGVLSVLASIILISLAPRGVVERLFRSIDLPWIRAPEALATLTSLLALGLFCVLIAIGIAGPRDPLTNLWVMSFWVGFWIILFAVIGLTVDLWRYLNPWTGLATLLFRRDHEGVTPLPERLGAWPGLALFLAFCAFYVADPAPLDPDRLARMGILYWLFTFAAIWLFGTKNWMDRGEAFAILFALISRCGVLSRGRVGLPGWQLVSGRALALGYAVFAVAILGVGSFDGLKETFWWLGLIGINPLEFPGRSFVMGSSLAGLLASSLGLFVVFTAAIWLGERMARGGAEPVPLQTLITRFAPTILPIALAYHISHFWITFLVDGQYLLAAIGDPLARGQNLLGLGDLRITTGFLNTPDSVKLIWITQAGIVVLGHILAVLVSHHVALSVFGTPRRAVLSQLPIACFMVLYTLFGLWLLASPRGI